MGAYVLRVTATRVKCSDGKEANVAVFAYKPYYDEKYDAPLRFKTGCVASEKLAQNGRLTDRFVVGDPQLRVPFEGEPVRSNEGMCPVFFDSDFDDYFPPIEGVTIISPCLRP